MPGVTARAAALAAVLAAAGASCREPSPAAAPIQSARPRPADFPCVHFEDLRRHLPKDIAGFRATRDEGSSGRYGEVSISEAERVFSGEDGQSVTVRIVDTTLSEDLGRVIREASRAPGAIVGEGAVGFVRFDEGERKAEANLLVADRFVVAVTAQGFDGTSEVRRIAGALDFQGLARLR